MRKMGILVIYPQRSLSKTLCQAMYNPTYLEGLR
ncbi:hypothetical protein IX332_000267 [Porphyromonas levii]|nr:hypothetical protein [Porphyromonas levii]